jgi:hypothetical protein
MFFWELGEAVVKLFLVAHGLTDVSCSIPRRPPAGLHVRIRPLEVYPRQRTTEDKHDG